MSRQVFNNDKYTMAIGVDHTPTGAFFQLWEKVAEGENPKADEMEQPQIECDEVYGLRIYNQKTLERNPRLAAALKTFIDYAKGSIRTEECVVGVGKACELEIKRAVFQLWD